MYDITHKLHFVDKDKNHHSLNLFTEQKDCKADFNNQIIDSSHMIVVTTVDGPRYCPVACTKANSDGNLCVNTSDGVRYSYNKILDIEVSATNEIVDSSGGYETSFKETIKINSYVLNSALSFDVVIKVYDKDKNLKIERTIKKGVTNVSLDSPESFTQDFDKNTSGQYYIKVYSLADYEEMTTKIKSYSIGIEAVFVSGYIYEEYHSDDFLNDYFIKPDKDKFVFICNGVEKEGDWGRDNSSVMGDNWNSSVVFYMSSLLFWYNMAFRIDIKNSDEAIASGLPEYNSYKLEYVHWTHPQYGGWESDFTLRRYIGGQKDLTNRYYRSGTVGPNDYLAIAILDNI